MTNQRTMVVLLAPYFVLTFLWRLSVPDHEMPSPGLKLLTIAIDLAGIIGLVGITMQTVNSAKPGDGKGPWILGSSLGALAGVGLLVLHLSGPPPPAKFSGPLPAPSPSLTPAMTPAPPPLFPNQIAMATSPLSGKLAPTPPPVPTPPNETATATPDPSDKLALEAHFALYETHAGLMNKNLWMRARRRPVGYKEVTREDLHAFDEHAHDVLVEIEKLVELAPASNREAWRVRRDLVTLCSEQTQLFEANWNEWHKHGFRPGTRTAEPWQKEAMRLQNEIEAVEKRDTDLSQ